MSSRDIILKLWKIQYHLPPKLAIAVEKQTTLLMGTVFLNALFTKHLLLQLLINITMVLKKILSKNVTITINVLLQTSSKEYWIQNKERNINYFINCDIAMKLQKYVCGSQKYDLCICENLLIARADHNVLFNNSDELVLKCRHRNKIRYSIQFGLCNYSCFSFLGINIIENRLMIGGMKRSAMVICCS